MGVVILCVKRLLEHEMNGQYMKHVENSHAFTRTCQNVSHELGFEFFYFYFSFFEIELI